MKINIGKINQNDVIFDRDRANNGHIILVGASGSGKTTEDLRIITQLAEQGVTVLALDSHDVLADEQIHEAYRDKFSKYLNSIDVYKKGIEYPLFTPAIFADREEESPIDTIDSVTQIIADAFSFGVRQKSELRRAVRMVYNNGLYETQGFKAVGEMLDKIDTTKAIEVSERVSQLTDHNIFRDGEGFIQKEKINVLRISKFSLETQRIISEVVMTLVWRMATQGKFKDSGLYMFVDECHNLDMGKRGIMSQILVEGRKFNLNLLLSTQVVSQEAYMTKLMMQADLVMFFETAKNETRTVARLIDPAREEDWILILRHLECGEFVACGSLVLTGDHLVKKPLKVSARLTK